MSGQVDRIALPAARGFSAHSALPLLVGAGCYLMLLALAGRLLADPDIYWHVTAGRWITEHRTFPHTDPFSATFAGAPWIAKEWLSQLAFAVALDLAGWNGVALLAAAAVATAFGLLARALAEKLDTVAALSAVLIATMLTAPHIVARPHALALPVMVIWAAGLVRALDAKHAPSWRLLPLMVLWANLHGGFTLGLLLVAACALEAVLVADKGARGLAAWHWVRFGLLAALAACVTPYGAESILVTQRILGLGEALSIITEWQPQDFSRIGVFEISLLGAIGLVLYRGLTLPPVRILIVLGLVHMALSHVRNAELLALLAPLFVAKPLSEQIGTVRRADREQVSYHFTVGLAALIVAATVGLSMLRQLAPSQRTTPSGGVAALAHAKAGPVLNDYDFGGYLIYTGLAPFIDGRSELYGGAFIARHHRAVSLENLPDLLVLLEKYHIGATLFAPERPAVALLDRLPEWERLYSDEITVVHVRKAAAR